MKNRLGHILYWVGVAMTLPFVLLIGASIMRIFSQGFDGKYVSSAVFGLFCAAFSYSVGFMFRQMLTQQGD